MISEYLSKLSWIGIFLVGLFTSAQGTWIEKFLRYLWLGGLIDFILAWNDYIITFFVVLFLMRWIRDWRWLIVIALVVFTFLKFLV